MSSPIALPFSNFGRRVGALEDSTSIAVKNGQLATRGKISNFFTRRSTNRYAGDVLYEAVRQKYGLQWPAPSPRRYAQVVRTASRSTPEPFAMP